MRPRISGLLATVVALLALLALRPSLATGQASPNVTIAVRVLDSSSAPVPDADVSVVRDVSTALAHATTNAAGRTRLVVPRGPGSLQLIARRIGYQAAYRFFALPAGDSTFIELRLMRTPVTLETVKVSAAEDLKRKSYYLSAEDIENSNRTMLDASDIFKLRPDMMNSRGGAKACEVPWTDRTGWIENVFINGKRIVLAPMDSQYVYSRKQSLGVFDKPMPRPNPRLSRVGARPPTPSQFTQFSHMDTVLSILKGIKPEHIAEVTYHDCFDMSVDKNHSDLAMFIVLKPGIGYKPGLGTFVVPEDTTSRRNANAFTVDNLPRYRFRIVGIYDVGTGDPLPNVDVIDSVSGNRVQSTATGTVSLFFVPEGTNTLRLHRAGFRDTTVTVTISPKDTVPLTFVMSRQP